MMTLYRLAAPAMGQHRSRVRLSWHFTTDLQAATQGPARALCRLPNTPPARAQARCQGAAFVVCAQELLVASRTAHAPKCRSIWSLSCSMIPHCAGAGANQWQEDANGSSGGCPHSTGGRMCRHPGTVRGACVTLPCDAPDVCVPLQVCLLPVVVIGLVHSTLVSGAAYTYDVARKSLCCYGAAASDGQGSRRIRILTTGRIGMPTARRMDILLDWG